MCSWTHGPTSASIQAWSSDTFTFLSSYPSLGTDLRLSRSANYRSYRSITQVYTVPVSFVCSLRGTTHSIRSISPFSAPEPTRLNHFMDKAETSNIQHQTRGDGGLVTCHKPSVLHDDSHGSNTARYASPCPSILESILISMHPAGIHSDLPHQGNAPQRYTSPYG